MVFFKFIMSEEKLKVLYSWWWMGWEGEFGGRAEVGFAVFAAFFIKCFSIFFRFHYDSITAVVWPKDSPTFRMLGGQLFPTPPPGRPVERWLSFGHTLRLKTFNNQNNIYIYISKEVTTKHKQITTTKYKLINKPKRCFNKEKQLIQ